jgi:hypothetical protein
MKALNEVNHYTIEALNPSKLYIIKFVAEICVDTTPWKNNIMEKIADQ